MIPKIIKSKSPNRRASKPFDRVVSYITSSENLERLASQSSSQKFSNLLNYTTKQRSSKTGEDKCVAIQCRSITDIRFAAMEMNAVALKNTRCKSPVLHMVLSWHEQDSVTNESMFKAAEHMLKKLGLEDHQAVMSIHADTDNPHCHVAVNRVHPDTFKSRNIEWANRSMHFAARELEIINGWVHDNGIYIVEADENGKKKIILNPDHDYRIPKKDIGKEKTYPNWTDREGLKSWLKSAISPRLIDVLPKLNDWVDLNEWFAQFDLQLVDSGGGGYRICAISGENGEEITIAASSGLRALSRQALEERWGKFSDKLPDQKRNSDELIEESSATRKSKHAIFEKNTLSDRTDTLQISKRDERREQRAVARVDLQNRYAQFCRTTKQDSANHALSLKNIKRIRAEHLKELRSRKNVAIRSLRKIESIEMRFLLVTEIEAQFIQDKAQLELNYRQKHESLNAARKPPLSWRNWLTVQAELGNQAALSALRGIVYQAQRDLKKGKTNKIQVSEPADAVSDEFYKQLMSHLCPADLAEIAIRPTKIDSLRPYQMDAVLVKYSSVQWEVTGNGNVVYRDIGEKKIFTDRGNRITFDREQVSDEDIKLALMHALYKFGAQITLTGSDPVFVNRMAIFADELGLQVLNPELGELILNYRKERDRHSKSSKFTALTGDADVRKIDPEAAENNHQVAQVTKTMSKNLRIESELTDINSTSMELEDTSSIGLFREQIPTDGEECAAQEFESDAVSPALSTLVTAQAWAKNWSEQQRISLVKARPSRPDVSFKILYVAEDGVVLGLGRSVAVYPVPEGIDVQIGDKVSVGASGTLSPLPAATQNHKGRSR